jgi:hypothetical protein
MRYQFVRLFPAMSVLAVVSFALPTPAVAQIATAPVEPQERDAPNTWFTASYAHLFETDVNGLGGVEVSRHNFLALGGHRFELSDSVGLTTQGVYQLTDYDFDGAGGVLWDDIHQFNAVALFDYQINESWSLLGGGIFRLAAEGGADVDDSLSGGGVGGFLYHWGENKTNRVGLLVGALSEIEDNATILPLPILNWQFADSWKLRLGVTQIAAIGYGPELTWMLTDSLDLGLGASYQRRRFRLDRGDRVGEETSVPIYAKFGFHPSQHSVIELFAGVAVGGEVRQETKGGSKIFDKDVDPAATLGLRGQIRF